MSRKPVLIVEDDDSIGTALQLSLEMLGYPSTRASNGAEALQKLETMPKPGLILLDLMMPVMDGWAFADAIDRKPGMDDIPIIVITAFSDRAHTLKKARRVLPKPVDLDVLIDAIQPYCG